ncbi:MAG: amidohydrolase family protein [Anaerolineae bacterium]
MLIIDFHTHILPSDLIARREALCEREPWFSRLYARPKARLATAEDLVAHMADQGIAASVTFGFPFQDVGLCRACNDYVLDAAERYPGALLPFGLTNPRDPEGISVARGALEAGALGLGELIPDGQGFALNDEHTLGPLMDLALEHRAPVLLHVSEPVGHDYAGKGWQGPREALELASSHPANSLVLAHWGGGLLFYEHMPEVRRACTNVYYDTAAGPLLYDKRLYQDALGWMPRKILFGTDYPLLSARRYLGVMRPDVHQWGGFLGGNAARLLGLAEGGGEQHV